MQPVLIEAPPEQVTIQFQTGDGKALQTGQHGSALGGGPGLPGRRVFADRVQHRDQPGAAGLRGSHPTLGPRALHVRHPGDGVEIAPPEPADFPGPQARLRPEPEEDGGGRRSSFSMVADGQEQDDRARSTASLWTTHCRPRRRSDRYPR
jgi:hypothetical protein